MIKATNSHETADANAMSADGDTLSVRTYLRTTGEHMAEDGIIQLARATNAEDLMAAWGVSRTTVIGKQKGERPMTLCEAWTLARMNGVKLSTLLRHA